MIYRNYFYYLISIVYLCLLLSCTAESVSEGSVVVEYLPMQSFQLVDVTSTKKEYEYLRNNDKNIKYYLSVQILTPSEMKSKNTLVSNDLYDLSEKTAYPHFEDYWGIYVKNSVPSLFQTDSYLLYSGIEKVGFKQQWYGEKAFWMSTSDNNILAMPMCIDYYILTSAGVLQISISLYGQLLLNELSTYGKYSDNGLEISEKSIFDRFYQDCLSSSNSIPQEIIDLFIFSDDIIKSLKIKDEKMTNWYDQNSDKIIINVEQIHH